MEQSSELLQRVSVGNMETAGMAVSSLAGRAMRALLSNDQEELKTLEPVLRRAYEYLSATNDPTAESTPVFLHGRVAQLIEVLNLVIQRD